MIKAYPKSHDEPLSKNFWLREFHCKCKYPNCTQTLVDEDLIRGLEELRHDVGQPLTINCGFRCERHNKDVGGSVHSLHKVGMAADVAKLKDVSPTKLSHYAKRIAVFIKGGIGIYFWGIHVDTRGTPTRWYG